MRVRSPGDEARESRQGMQSLICDSPYHVIWGQRDPDRAVLMMPDQFLLQFPILMRELFIDVLTPIAPGVWGRCITSDNDAGSWLEPYFNKVTNWCEEVRGEYLKSSCVFYSLAALPASIVALQAGRMFNGVSPLPHLTVQQKHWDERSHHRQR